MLTPCETFFQFMWFNTIHSPQQCYRNHISQTNRRHFGVYTQNTQMLWNTLMITARKKSWIAFWWYTYETPAIPPPPPSSTSVTPLATDLRLNLAALIRLATKPWRGEPLLSMLKKLIEMRHKTRRYIYILLYMYYI